MVVDACRMIPFYICEIWKAGIPLQKYFHTTWKYFLGGPETRNHENEHFQKSYFFQESTTMENEPSQKW